MFAPNISFNSPSNSPFLSVEYANWLAWPEAEALAFWYWSHLSWANLRAAFYLIGPNESTFTTVKDVPDYTIQVSAWWSLLLLLEFALLWLTGHSERFALNDSICSISAGILSQLLRSSGRTFCLSIYVWIWENWRLLELDPNSPWVWAACLVGQDFAYYLGHRAMHEINLLWAFHSVHHSSEFLNLSTAFRQPLLQDLGLAPFELLQAFLLPPPLFLVHRYFSHIYQFWLHTSLLGSLGPFGYILNSPAFHRVHHAQNGYCLDRNFGALFIIWDRIFGTFQGEKPEERPLQFGLANVDGPASFDQIKIQLSPIKMAIFDNFYEKGEKFGLKMRKLFWPPGWSPGQTTKQFFHWRSLIRPKNGELVQKHQYFPFGIIAQRHKNLPLYLKAYLLFHFLLLLPMFVHFQYNRLEMDWNEFGLKIAFFVVSIWTLGAFFDQNKISSFVEFIRCLGFCLYHFHQYRNFPLQFSSIVLITIFALSSAIFAIRPIHRKFSIRNDGKCGKCEGKSVVKRNWP